MPISTTRKRHVTTASATVMMSGDDTLRMISSHNEQEFTDSASASAEFGKDGAWLFGCYDGNGPKGQHVSAMAVKVQAAAYGYTDHALAFATHSVRATGARSRIRLELPCWAVCARE